MGSRRSRMPSARDPERRIFLSFGPNRPKKPRPVPADAGERHLELSFLVTEPTLELWSSKVRFLQTPPSIFYELLTFGDIDLHKPDNSDSCW
jgi:hypothetical protein